MKSEYTFRPQSDYIMINSPKGKARIYDTEAKVYWKLGTVCIEVNWVWAS